MRAGIYGLGVVQRSWPLPSWQPTNAPVTVAGFMMFIIASIAWMIDGWLEGKASLVIQNVILLVINVIGVLRWVPKAEKEAKS